MKSGSETVLFACALAGTFVFALEGARAAADAGLDYLGVLVLAFSTALAGGIVRDLLIGASPPQAVRDVRYPLTAFAGGVTVILLHGFTRLPSDAVMALDAGPGLDAFPGPGGATRGDLRRCRLDRLGHDAPRRTGSASHRRSARHWAGASASRSACSRSGRVGRFLTL